MTEKTVHILLVEDDNIDAEGIERALAKHRIANPLHRARDGIEALEMLRGEGGKAAIPAPHLLLLDLNMPRMNGIEFLQAIRDDSTLRATIVFVLTTSKIEEDKVAAYNFNVAGYMIKERMGDDFMRIVDMLNHYWKIIEFP